MWNFDYNGTTGDNGSIQSWTAPYSGKYKLEVWGAEGGSVPWHTTPLVYRGGYGAYSVGVIDLVLGNKLNIGVGGRGKDGQLSYTAYSKLLGGYNGGGFSYSGNTAKSAQYDNYAGSGGGATHIASKDAAGILSTISIGNVYIVAGAGGGASVHRYGELYWEGSGGDGGGYISNVGYCASDTYPGRGRKQPTAATQNSGGVGYIDSDGSAVASQGSFGKGADATHSWSHPGGGSGLYGGAGSLASGSSGGSGYIGNTNLISYGSVTKHMTGYNLTNTTTTANIRTQTTTCVSATATADCAKSGHGYARITFIEP